MKYATLFFFVLISFLFVSCDMITDPGSPDYLAYWYIEADAEGQGHVMVSLSGTTDALRVSLMTYDEGDEIEHFLELDTGRFEERICITVIDPPASPAAYSTELRFYREGMTETIVLTSPLLTI